VSQNPRSDISGALEGRLDEEAPPVPEDDRITQTSLPMRLYGSKHAHRLLPAPLALAVAAEVGPAVRQRRNPAERRDAENFMRELLLHTPRAAEAEALAKDWLKEKARLRELFWRPWLLKRSRIRGTEHWDAARPGGRACIIVLGHFGPTAAVPTILEHNGFHHYLVASPHYWKPMAPGYEGLATLYRRREYIERIFGSRVIPADARPERFLELLEGGESIAIAFDVPGFAATPFLGRNLALGGGPTTLALKTKSRILPVFPERHGSRIDLRLLAPLDPVEYSDPRSLRAAIAQTFEPLVVANPECVELAWIPSPLISGITPDVSSMTAERAS
jgi:lauroyl/myristoyl acyltransferase